MTSIRVLKKLRLLLCLLFLLAFGGLPASLRSSPSEATSNDFCPVTPKEWSEHEFSTEYQGKTVAFCCARCRRKFLEDPAPYLSRLPQFGGSLENIETSAPHAHIEESESPVSDEDHHADMGVPEAHDHGRDHGPRTSTSLTASARTYRFAGKLHPMVVHFPIALLLLGFGLEVGFLMTRQPLFSQSTRLVVGSGCLSAILAALFGWAAASNSHYPADLAQVLDLHRMLGLSLAGGSVALLILSERHHQGSNPRVTLAYRVGLAMTAALVAVTGHLGGSLIFGVGHLTW